MLARDVDVVGRRAGLAEAMLGERLAELVGEGLLRINGDKRAEKYGSFLASQKAKSVLGVEARMATSVLTNTKVNPAGCPPGHPGVNPDLLSLDLRSSQSLPDSQTSLTLPDSGVARANQQAKRLAAQEACGSWVEWFNRRFNRSFRVTQELTKLVAALLTRGYSEKPDMRGVALYLRSRWEDDERMAPHLVPSTILRPTKFPERLDLAREWDRESGGNIWQVQS